MSRSIAIVCLTHWLPPIPSSRALLATWMYCNDIEWVALTRLDRCPVQSHPLCQISFAPAALGPDGTCNTQQSKTLTIQHRSSRRWITPLKPKVSLLSGFNICKILTACRSSAHLQASAKKIIITGSSRSDYSFALARIHYKMRRIPIIRALVTFESGISLFDGIR